ncbi:calmodulin [Strigomonas culicis]|nr:calmodulin [Strigomonas culicis]|eukprot:EPY34507.1 calmodulin [Strigomonas culicis]
MSTADPDGRKTCSFDGFCAALELAFERCVTAEDAKEAFLSFDANHKGFITPHELRYFLTTLGDALTVEEANNFINAVMSEADSEGNIILLDAVEKMTPEMYR